MAKEALGWLSTDEYDYLYRVTDGLVLGQLEAVARGLAQETGLYCLRTATGEKLGDYVGLPKAQAALVKYFAASTNKPASGKA